MFGEQSAAFCIVQNAIDCAHVLGIVLPRVAVLAAVEVVNPRMPSTTDAASLCKMAERGQITGGLLEGPLAFDNAISVAAAAETGIVSEIAGEADILVVSDLETGNMLAKEFTFLAAAQAAGVWCGGGLSQTVIGVSVCREAREKRTRGPSPAC